MARSQRLREPIFSLGNAIMVHAVIGPRGIFDIDIWIFAAVDAIRSIATQVNY
jgi:hypothetical protein